MAKIEGLDEFKRAMKRAPEIALKGLAAGLFTSGERIMSRSKDRTPVETGRLRASGHVTLPQITGTKASVTLAYGTEYAVFVHEKIGPHHPVGEAKFLEKSLNEARPTIGADLAKEVRRALERLG